MDQQQTNARRSDRLATKDAIAASIAEEQPTTSQSQSPNEGAGMSPTPGMRPQAFGGDGGCIDC
jgi:hypothetical protein